MKIKAAALVFIVFASITAPAVAATYKPILSEQVSTYPMVNEKCSKAGQWAGFADSRYTLKTWKRVDTSDQFREFPGSYFGIFICKLTNSKLTWQHFSPYDMNFAPGGVYSASSPFMAKILSQRSIAYPGAGKKCEVNNCPLGSTGPAGGTIFYDAGKVQSWGRYLEVAPQGWTGLSDDQSDPAAYWCDNLPPLSLGSVSDLAAPVGSDPSTTTIGTGQSLTSRMLKRCATGAASVATSYFGGGSTDWFLPSMGDSNELCKFSYGLLNTPEYIFCDYIGNPRLGLKGIYWSSQQLIPKLPVIGVADYENYKFGVRTEGFRTVSANVDAYYAVRPIRAFASPADPLPKVGLIQMSGVGDASWPAKCPAVVDRGSGPQPQVTGFYFDGTKENFVRLEDNSSAAVTSAKNLVGCYADLKSLTSRIGNGYHVGSINRDSKGYYWQNAQGVKFGLTLAGSVLNTDQSNPYYAEGHQFVLKP